MITDNVLLGSVESSHEFKYLSFSDLSCRNHKNILLLSLEHKISTQKHDIHIYFIKVHGNRVQPYSNISLM